MAINISVQREVAYEMPPSPPTPPSTPPPQFLLPSPRTLLLGGLSVPHVGRDRHEGGRVHQRLQTEKT